MAMSTTLENGGNTAPRTEVATPGMEGDSWSARVGGGKIF